MTFFFAFSSSRKVGSDFSLSFYGNSPVEYCVCNSKERPQLRTLPSLARVCSFRAFSIKYGSREAKVFDIYCRDEAFLQVLAHSFIV